MYSNLKILFVEDVAADAELIWHVIEKSELTFTRKLVDNSEDFVHELHTNAPDLIISDYSLPKFDGMSALTLRNELSPLTPFILVTGSVNEEVAVECMRNGADDYILKDNLSRLGPAIINSIKKLKLSGEKKAAEDDLRRSEQRLQKAQAIAHVGNWELDLSSQLIWCSDEAINIYGLDHRSREFPYEAIKNSPLPEFRPMLDDTLNRLLKYNESYDIEFKIRRVNDGAVRSILSKAELILEPDGEQVKVIGVIQDITERKDAEEAIILERRMLRTLIDNLPDPIYVEDKDCRKVIANKADLENIGCLDEAEVIGKTDLELFPGKIGERGYADDRRVIISGKPIFDLEEEFINHKGAHRWLQTTKIPLHDNDGNITGLVGIGHDITESKRVQAELQQSYIFSQSLLNTIPFGMHIVDESGNVLFQSDNFIRLFGGKGVGEKCWKLYRDDKKQCGNCPLKHGIILGETEAFESGGVLGNRIFEINHTGMVYEGKKAVLEIFQDITERKNSEIELIRAKEKAEESDKLKTAFLHNISHEIRTPMNAIVGFSALLGEPDVDDFSRKSYIDVIMQSSNHLLSIITDIVDISNIEANLIKTVKNEISLNHTLKSLCNQFAPKANDKKISLECHTSLSDTDALILSDRTKLTQIISNLISNSVKFTDYGSVILSYVLKDNFIEFRIADTGIGIPAQYQDKVFDRFYQVQNTVSRLYEGTGLGLAISKAYVELLGGKIWLTSEPGSGTTFFFTIPYEKHVELVSVESERKPPEGFIFPAKKVILVAEDIESNLKLIKYFLTGSNVEVIHAYNGKEAVEKCQTTDNIDLILMDIKMPVMDGYTAVKIIREKNEKIPIIAQTAYADDRDRAIECGCSGFISKPFDKKGLFKVLTEFI
jgi:PAS domain S-box-containing protein